MVNANLVTSGFDIEFLMSEAYIRSFILSSLETGSIPWWSESVNSVTGQVDVFILHPPESVAQKRLYEVPEGFVPHPYQDLISLNYRPDDEGFEVTILDDNEAADIRLRILPSIIIDLNNPDKRRTIESVNGLDIMLDIRFGITADEETFDNGITYQENARVAIELIDIGGTLITFAESLRDENGNPVFSKEDTLATLKEQLDRDINFSGAGEGALQQIVSRKIPAANGAPKAIGVFINLLMLNTPAENDFLPNRGDLAAAQNFIPEGHVMAFAFREPLFNMLAADFKNKVGVLKPDSTDEYHFPMMKDGEEVGKIKGVSVYPEVVQVNENPETGGPATSRLTNSLVIDIHGEYYFIEIDPDFHFRLFLRPVYTNGMLEFTIDYDFDAGLLDILLLASVILSFVLPKIFIAISVLLVIGSRLAEDYGEEMGRAYAEEELGSVNFLETLPNKLLLEKRDWDPLYTSEHRLAVQCDNHTVDRAGFRFSASDVFFSTTKIPAADVVIRSEIRDDSSVLSGLVYRAKHLQEEFSADLERIYPATNRMPFEYILEPDGDLEKYRVALTLQQIQDRISAKLLVRDIEYIPVKVDIRDHQIFQILALSKLEIPEIESYTRAVLRRELRDENEETYRAEAIEALEAALGRTPEETEISQRVSELLSADVDRAYYPRYVTEYDRHQAFDLEPFEFAQLQRSGILILGKDHLVIRQMTRNDRITVYYRDHEPPFLPGPTPQDNLMSLPRYRRT